MKTKFINALVLRQKKGSYILEKSHVLVDGDKIVNVNRFIVGDADRVIDVDNNILMPGFVNAHAHNSMTLLRGIKNDVPLQVWLFDYMFSNEKKLTKEDIYWGEYLGIAESLKAGVTTFEENYFYFESIIKAIKKSGIRARVGIGKDYSSESLQNDLENAIKLFDNFEMIKPVVYPHSIYTVSPEEMEIFVSFAAKHKLPISTHLSETLKEVGDCIAENKMTPPQYLESIGFFDRKSALYHCVHMDKEDIQILQNYNVDVVTCPSSNLKLGSGFAPLHTFNTYGINVAIGTDGVASNDSIDMFKEMFLSATLPKAVLSDAQVMPVNTVLKMATENGAKALGFDKIGKIEEGFKADLILVDVKGLHHQPQNDLISNLVYSAKSSDVYLTMVNGKILYENGKFNIGENIETIVEKCKDISKKFNK